MYKLPITIWYLKIIFTFNYSVAINIMRCFCKKKNIKLCRNILNINKQYCIVNFIFKF